MGFGIYYVDIRAGYKFVNCLNIDVISDYDGSTASDLIRTFKFIMQLEEFKKVDQKIILYGAIAEHNFVALNSMTFYLMSFLNLERSLISISFQKNTVNY